MDDLYAAYRDIHILIVEDSRTQAEQLRYLLETNNFTVTVATNGVEALERLREKRPTLIISDIMMPEMDGFELCKAVKDDSEFKDIPVILVTSLTRPNDVIQGLEVGANNFLRKPYGEQNLLQRINYILTNRALRGSDNIHAGIEIRVAGKVHFITAERQQILDLLISSYEDAVNLNTELERSNQTLNALYRLAQGLNRCVNEEQVVDTVLELSMHMPGIQAGWIMLTSNDQSFTFAGHRHLNPTDNKGCDLNTHFSGTEIALTYPSNVPECAWLQQAAPQHPGWKGHVCVPLQLNHTLLGVLNLVGPDRGLCSAEMLKTLDGLGRQVGMALERVRLHQHLEELVEIRTEALQAEIVERKRIAAEQARLTAILEATPDMVAMIDADFNVLYINPAGQEIMGIQSEEYLSRLPGGNGYPAWIRKQEWNEGQSILMEEGNWQHETTLVNEHDEEIPVSQVVLVHRDAEGEIERYSTITRDITHRKQQEERIRRQLQRLAGLRAIDTAITNNLELTPKIEVVLQQTIEQLEVDAAAVLLWDEDQQVLSYENGAGFHTDLITQTRLTTKDFPIEDWRENDAAKITDLKQADSGRSDLVAAEGFKSYGIVRLHSKETDFGVLEVFTREQLSPDKEWLDYFVALAGQAAIAIDVTRLFSQIQHQAQLTQQIIDTVPEGSVVLDREGRLVFANPTARKYLPDLIQLTSGDQVASLGGHSLEFVFEMAASDDSWHEIKIGEPARIFEVAAQPLAGGAHAGGCVFVLREVTEERERQRYQQAQERLATVGQLAAGIAHDFNNVMGVIVLYSEMLENIPDLPSKYKHYLSIIGDQAHHATNLIAQILDYGRQSVMDRTAMNLLPLLKEMFKLLERTFPETIRLTLNYNQENFVVLADPTRLQQAFMNLALNARDAMETGGELTFSLSQLSVGPDETPPLPDMEEGDWVLVTASDTGVGITADHISSIFEPFFTTKEPGKGTGLGLAQVHGIVKQHDGSINVTSQEGVGTTFAVYLPMKPEEAEESEKYSKDEGIPGGTERILLVEDNEPLRVAVTIALEELGYEVLTAENGAQGLSLYNELGGDVSLILTDLVMPEMSGFEMINAIQEQSPSVKVVVMAGYPKDESQTGALAKRVLDWIQKPIDLVGLSARVRAALDK
jgi:PAS domain S-box-containing protein